MILNKRGFTVLEGILVFAIILVGAFVLSLFLNKERPQSSAESKVIACRHNLAQIGRAIANYQSENGFNTLPVIEPATPGISTEAETARSLALLFTNGFIEEPYVFQCALASAISPWPPLAEEAEKGTGKSYRVAKEMTATEALEGTSYLMTANFSEKDKARKVMVADRAGGDGFSSNHMGREATIEQKGVNVLFQDGTAKTIWNKNGYVPDSAGNESIPLWIAEPSSNASGDTAAIMGAPRKD